MGSAGFPTYEAERRLGRRMLQGWSRCRSTGRPRRLSLPTWWRPSPPYSVVRWPHRRPAASRRCGRHTPASSSARPAAPSTRRASCSSRTARCTRSASACGRSCGRGTRSSCRHRASSSTARSGRPAASRSTCTGPKQTAGAGTPRPSSARSGRAPRWCSCAIPATRPATSPRARTSPPSSRALWSAASSSSRTRPTRPRCGATPASPPPSG